jgi:hypothetical protein
MMMMANFSTDVQTSIPETEKGATRFFQTRRFETRIDQNRTFTRENYPKFFQNKTRAPKIQNSNRN